MAVTWTKIGERSVKATGMVTTEAAPTLATDGMDVAGMGSFSLTLECDVGQTFSSAAGQLDVYWFDPLIATWSYVGNAFQQIPPEAAGKRRFTLVLDVQNARGRIALIPNGVVVSAGGLTEYYAPVVSAVPGRAL